MRVNIASIFCRRCIKFRPRGAIQNGSRYRLYLRMSGSGRFLPVRISKTGHCPVGWRSASGKANVFRIGIVKKQPIVQLVLRESSSLAEASVRSLPENFRPSPAVALLQPESGQDRRSTRLTSLRILMCPERFELQPPGFWPGTRLKT